MGFGQFGFIIVFLGLGAFTGTLIFGRLGPHIKRPKAISIGFILTGLALTLFSYTTHIFKNFWLTGILAIILGLSSAPIMIIANTLLHEVTLEEMRGRVFSTLEIVIHLAFLIFMFLSMFLVTTLKMPTVHILGTAGGLAFIYGILEWLRQRST
jgi:MFS family permease